MKKVKDKNNTNFKSNIINHFLYQLKCIYYFEQ